ncbi:MAG: hypothetical protein Q9160_000506 [Pyrenula sp. 1 TL-2023]
MSKRRAEKQGRKETGLEEDPSTPMSDIPQRATAAQLAQRNSTQVNESPSQQQQTQQQTQQQGPQQGPQPTSNFTFTPSSTTNFGAQSASFPPNQPSSSQNPFTFSTQASNSFPSLSSTSAPDKLGSAGSSSVFGGFQGSMFNIPPATQQATSQAQSSTFKPAAPGFNTQDNSDLSMRDDTGDTQATPKPNFTFGTPASQVNTNSVFGQSFGQPKSFPPFGSLAKDGVQQPQENSRAADAPKNVFGGFGQKETEPSKTPSTLFTSSVPKTNGFSANNTPGASASKPPSFSFVTEKKDDSSNVPPTPFGQPASQVNGINSGKQSSSGNAETNKPLFGAVSSSTVTSASTMPNAQAAGPSSASGAASSSNGMFTPSASNISTSTASSQPAKPLFSFTKPQEGTSAPQASFHQNADKVQQAPSLFGKKEDLQKNDTENENNVSGSPAPSKTSSLFSKLAQSQSSATEVGITGQKPMPKFNFGMQPATAQKSSETVGASSSIFAPKPLQSATAPSFGAPQKDPGLPAKETGKASTAKETTKPAFPAKLSSSQLEDPFVSPARPLNAVGTGPNISSTSANAGGTTRPNIFGRVTQPTSAAASSLQPAKPSTALISSSHVDSNGKDMEISGPSQRIKFSSRGPSSVPGSLDNSTRVKFDSAHRLRSLNEGLLDYLKSLDPSSDDFGRRVEYYVDARQALGKPLKYHERASAGEKRKVAEESATEEIDRAPKRHKSTDGGVTPQTSIKPATSAVFAQAQNPASAIGHNSSTTSSAPQASEQQAPSLPSFKPAETSIFGRSQTNSGDLGGSFLASPFAPRSSDQPTPNEHAFSKDSSASKRQDEQAVVSSTNLAPKAAEKRKSAVLDAEDIETSGSLQACEDQPTKRVKLGTDLSSSHIANEEAEPIEESESNEESEEEEDAWQDTTYDPEDDENGGDGDQDGDSDNDETDGDQDDDDDENDLQKAMNESRKVSPSKSTILGKSLFDRIEPPPNKPSEDAAAESKKTPSPTGESSQPSNSSIFGTKSNTQGQYPSSFSTFVAPASSSSTSNLFSKKTNETSQSSLFSSSTGLSFGASGKNTSSMFGSSVFGSKLSPADSATKPTSSGNSSAGTPPSMANGFPGTGLFGSRPATPDEEARDKTRPQGASIFDKTPTLAGDHTFKEGTPIKFSNQATAPTPSLNLTAPSPKGKENQNPNGGLFGFDGNNTVTKPKPAQASLGVGFGFGSPSKLTPPSLLASSVTSSANTSRATSPGASATETDSATEGVEDSHTDTQVNLMESRPGEENDDILFDVPKARAFVLDGGWKHKAYGPLRILKDRGTGKTRILFRMDPGSQIIINSLLVPTFEYKAVASGKDAGSITCLVPKEEGKMESWLFKNGKLEVTKELARVMEENKMN